ncbi:cupin [Natroniella sulfidigena]|uniref:cupin domain-containing protein n=1 Tax=Natroniella sulfidigena TaxID=723921 RepID=UPI00200A889D|nr:cupin [Natroniella sulfidigena]MCK8817562.1 cupin [Natroniella sulfidigena]
MKKFKLTDYIVEPKGKLAKRVIYQDENVTSFILNIYKGESLPSHTHFDCTMLLQVIQGRANLSINNKTSSIRKNDLIQITGSESMSIENIGAQTLILYITTSPSSPSDKYSVNVDL